MSRKKTVFVRFSFNTVIDADILEHIKTVSSFSGYVKALIMYDMKHRVLSDFPVKRFRVATKRGQGSSTHPRTANFAFEYLDEQAIYKRLKSAPSGNEYIKKLIRLDMAAPFIRPDMVSFFQDCRQGKKYEEITDSRRLEYSALFD